MKCYGPYISRRKYFFCGMLQVGIDHLSLPRTHFLTAEAILCARSILFFFPPHFTSSQTFFGNFPFLSSLWITVFFECLLFVNHQYSVSNSIALCCHLCYTSLSGPKIWRCLVWIWVMLWEKCSTKAMKGKGLFWRTVWCRRSCSFVFRTPRAK